MFVPAVACRLPAHSTDRRTTVVLRCRQTSRPPCERKMVQWWTAEFAAHSCARPCGRGRLAPDECLRRIALRRAPRIAVGPCAPPWRRAQNCKIIASSAIATFIAPLLGASTAARKKRACATSSAERSLRPKRSPTLRRARSRDKSWDWRFDSSANPTLVDRAIKPS